jgi:hypothetical protein
MDLERDIDPVLLAAYADPVIYPIGLIYIDWPTGPVRAHSGKGMLTFEGEEFAGVGELGGMNIPNEAAGIVPQQATLAISAVTGELLTYASEAAARGRLVTIWSGLTTTAGGVDLIGVPHKPFTGSIEKSDFQLSEDRRISTLTLLVKAGQPARSGAQVVHSDEDQQAAHPGDTLFRRVAHAAKWNTNPPQWPAP